MKKLMFSVAGASALSLVSGCCLWCSDVGPFVGEDGRKLTTATGAKIEVVEVPRNSAPVEVSEDATMEERIAARKQNAKRKVQISVVDAEVAKEVVEETQIAIIAKLRSADDFQKLKLIVVFVEGRPQVTKAAIEEAAGRQVSEGTAIALRAMMEKEIARSLKENNYPKLIEQTLKKLEPAVESAVAEGKFGLARNLIWAASTRGIPEVDAPVRERAVELMHAKVNPANWKVVEARLAEIFDKAMAAGAWDEGIRQLEACMHESIQQEYSQLIEKKLVAVKRELLAIGVSEKDMEPILEKRRAVIAAAEEIFDRLDTYKVIEEARIEDIEVAPRQDPVLKAYYEKLDELRDTLVKFSCIDPSAEQVAVDFDRDLMTLIEMLRRPPQTETKTTEEKKALMLGTYSLNKRIRDTAADYVSKLVAARTAAYLAQIRAKLEAARDELQAKVRALVAEGKHEEARELIWNSAITGDAEWDANMFAFGVQLLREIVNPSDWNRIEAEILAKFKELSEAGRYDELVKYLNDYPLIRQHTVKLDEQLARVRAEAQALGADPARAEEAARLACGMVTEANDLVDHIDRIVEDVAAKTRELDMSKLQEELQKYAERLSAYHATPANVTRIVSALRLELEKLILRQEDPARAHLELGTNAVNDRLRALIAKLLASIPETKHEWEETTYEVLVSDLEERVRAAVAERRFTDARNLIRDEKLIGREELDAQLYVLRVGLLDCCVNPAQLDYLLDEIEEKIAEFKANGDYLGLIDYVNNYPYVHDEYARIDAALAAVRKAMETLGIPQPECARDEKIRFADSIRTLLEQRREVWTPERDVTDLTNALQQVSVAMFDHLNIHPESIKAEQVEEFQHILADISVLDRTITTWELNELLRVRLEKELRPAKAGAERQFYLEELAKIDSDVSFDAQIALAEEAISRQLGQKCDRATYKINAVLGEYARAFRLLKKNERLAQAEATSILLGAAYLEQGAVIRYALELGADINGVSARDPRRRTALMLAIDAQNLSLMRKLIEADASLTAADAAGNTVLHYAVKSGSITAVRAVAKGAPMTVVNAEGETPLYEAVRRNQSAMARTVLELVAEGERKEFVNSADKKGLTAFALAAKIGSRDVLDPLADAGAVYGTAELILAEEGDHVAIAQWLVAQGADVNAEGVMAKACPSTATGRYLIGEGGVGEHSCDACTIGGKTEVIDVLKQMKDLSIKLNCTDVDAK